MNYSMPGKDRNSPYCKVCARFVPERLSPAALAEVIDTILEQSGMRSGVHDYNAETCCYLCKTALQRNQTPSKFQQMLTVLTSGDGTHSSPSGCLTVCLGILAIMYLLLA